MKNRRILLEDKVRAQQQQFASVPRLSLAVSQGPGVCFPDDTDFANIYVYPPTGEPALYRTGTSTQFKGKEVYYTNSGKAHVYDPTTKKTLYTWDWICTENLEGFFDIQLNYQLQQIVNGIRELYKNDSIPTYGNEVVLMSQLEPKDRVSGSWKIVKLRDYVKDKPELPADTKTSVNGPLGDAEIYVYQGPSQNQKNMENVSLQRYDNLGYKPMGNLTQAEKNWCYAKKDIRIQSVQGAGGTPVEVCLLGDTNLGTKLLNLQKTADAAWKGNTDAKAVFEACQPFVNTYAIAAKKDLYIQPEFMQTLKGSVKGCLESGRTKGFLKKGFKYSDSTLDTLSFGERDSMGKQDTTWVVGDARAMLQGDRAGQLENYQRDNLLKKLIRENLNNLHEEKKKSIIQEEKIIKNRFSIIGEGKTFKTKKEQKLLAKELFNETIYLSSQGYDKKLINEGFWDFLTGIFGNAPEGIIEYFKEQFGQWLVGKMGIEQDGWLANILIAAVGEFPVMDIGKLTDCDYLSKYLSGSIAEGAIRKVQYQSMGGGFFYDALRNALVESMKQTTFGDSIQSFIGDFICPSLTKIAGNMQDVTKSMKDGALGLS